MTNADVARVISNAAARGRVIDTYDAAVFLGAKEILEREPENRNARTVVANFTEYLATGKKPWSFAEFLLPTPYTDEELAVQERQAAEYIRATRGSL